MARTFPIGLASCLLSLVLAACGGGGGSGGERSSAATSVSGNESRIDNSRRPVAYAEADAILPFITRADVPEDGHVVIEFQLTDSLFSAIVDLAAEDFSLTVAKLQNRARQSNVPVGNLSGNWQSYINRIEQPPASPDLGSGTEKKLQATSESGTSGEFTNNGDGTYRYRFAASIKAAPEEFADQARSEDLSLAYEAQRTHRVGMQFSNAQTPANPTYDWLPATGEVTYLFRQQIAATANCNLCHDQLAYHGGGRIEVDYCVTCHNAGTSDANSGNTLDFKVMVHKIHMGSKLPSFELNKDRVPPEELKDYAYILWGFRDAPHDYSRVTYPNDIRDCNKCHAGTASDPGDGSLVLTPQGDNWNQFSTARACGSCHDYVTDGQGIIGNDLSEDAFFAQHYGGQSSDENCMSCHGVQGPAGTIASTHINYDALARDQIAAEILHVDQSMAGEYPIVTFRVYNPEDGSNYDILNDPFWQDGSLSVKLGWPTSDYTNVGNQNDRATTLSIDAKTLSEPVGDGSFMVSFEDASPPKPIPDEGITPGIPATGSGAAVVEGKAWKCLALDVDTGNCIQSEDVHLTNAASFYAISDEQPVPRRESVELSRCLNCHEIVTINYHGGNRTNNIDSCLTCHNPRLSSSSANLTANFKPMIHRIHSATLSQPDPGPGSDDDRPTRYPGNLANCLGCHTEDGYKLPLPAGALATTTDPGSDILDPTDDTVTTAITSTCSSCHGGTTSIAHMESNGGSFDTTQAEIDAGTVVEQCNTCHGTGRTYAVETVHGLE